MATRLPTREVVGWAAAPGPDAGTREGRSTSLRGGPVRTVATRDGRHRPAPAPYRTQPQARPNRVSRNRLIPLSGLPLASGATRSAHPPTQPAAVRSPGRGPGRPAPAPRGGRGFRSRRRLPHRDAGLRVRIRAGVRIRGRTRLGARSGAGRGRPCARQGSRGGLPRTCPGATGRRRIACRLPGAPPAAGARPAARPGAPDAGGQAHRPRLLAAGDRGAAGVRVPGPAAPGRRAARVRLLLPAGQRGRGDVGQAVRPDLCAGHPADRVHDRRAADPPRCGRVRRAADGRLHGPRAERRLALRRHADLRAARDRPPRADHRAASGQPSGESTAGRAVRAAGPVGRAAGGPGAAGYPSAAGGSPARAADAAIAAPTIPALF